MNEFVPFLAIASMISAPTIASVRDAAFSTSADRPVAQTSTFVGLSYRVGLRTRTGQPTGMASLKIAAMSKAPESADMKLADGLQLGAGKSGRATLFLAGREAGDLQKAANLNGTTTAILAVAGVALLVGVIFLATHCDNDCENARGE